MRLPWAMTVETTLTKKKYEGNGVAKVFPIPFPVQDADQLYLILISASGEDIDITTNYQVNRNSKEEIVSITYPVIGPPLSAGIKLLIYRDTERKQIADITNAGAYHPEVVEHVGLDRIVMMIQELQEALDRCLKVPITSDMTAEEWLEYIFSIIKQVEYYWSLIQDAMDQIAGVACDSIVKVATEPRKLCDKLKETLSIKDFGAKGNGSADDTTAIQDAFDSGYSVFFPPGRYMVTRSLNVPFQPGFTGRSFSGPPSTVPINVEDSADIDAGLLPVLDFSSLSGNVASMLVSMLFSFSVSAFEALVLPLKVYMASTSAATRRTRTTWTAM